VGGALYYSVASYIKGGAIAFPGGLSVLLWEGQRRFIGRFRFANSHDFRGVTQTFFTIGWVKYADG
jgi:hypothetical protein